MCSFELGFRRFLDLPNHGIVNIVTAVTTSKAGRPPAFYNNMCWKGGVDQTAPRSEQGTSGALVEPALSSNWRTPGCWELDSFIRLTILPDQRL